MTPPPSRRQLSDRRFRFLVLLEEDKNHGKNLNEKLHQLRPIDLLGRSVLLDLGDKLVKMGKQGFFKRHRKSLSRVGVKKLNSPRYVETHRTQRLTIYDPLGNCPLLSLLPGQNGMSWMGCFWIACRAARRRPLSVR